MIKKTTHLYFLRIFSFLVFALLFILPGNAQDSLQLKLGGALRFNYNLSSWKDGQKKRGGDFGYDVFRLNAKAAYKGIFLDAEYRLYSEGFGGGFLKQGWIGYNFDEVNQIQLGLTQVPFGIQKYNSNNWFLNIAYYTGLEDDYDMGIKYIHTGDIFEYQLAFFKNAEELKFGDNTEISPNRYSYDIAGRNKEINQFNGKLIYKFGKDAKHRIGFSGEYGKLYNLDTESLGDHSALAVHYEFTTPKWNAKAQFITATQNPINADGESRDIVLMAAYGTPYEVAADFNIYTLGVSRNIPVKLGPISSLQIYNDFGFMQKKTESFEDSYTNITGVMLAAGNVYTYIDYAAGYNHSWLGGNFVDDFSSGNADAKWEARFNVNIGYYF